MCNGEYVEDKKIVLYNYKEGRSQTDAREVLSGYSGYIMCDGYSAYDALTHTGRYGEPPMDVQLVACLVHVNRKFKDALKLLPEKERADTSCYLAVKKLQSIFHMDKKWKDLPAEERKKERQKCLKPLLDDFFVWVKREQEISLSKTHYGQALEYALNQKDKVMRVLEDGRLELNNSLAERCVKPFVIGRKNWLFANTPGGADASCIIYSIVQTAKANDLDPYKYIEYVLKHLSQIENRGDNDYRNYLPWSETIPENIKNPSE